MLPITFDQTAGPEPNCGRLAKTMGLRRPGRPRAAGARPCRRGRPFIVNQTTQLPHALFLDAHRRRPTRSRRRIETMPTSQTSSIYL